jgi:hypothetical protein
MTFERFVKQLDGCSFCSGGLNCSAASEAMWLYRASQGRISTTSCAVRRLTNDTVGGLNLRQVAAVSDHYGLTGALWLPGQFDKLRELVLTGRYGAIVQVGYSQIAGSQFDCFSGGFRGGHALYVSRGTVSTAHYADPGADGRRAGIPSGYQDMPWDRLERAASALPLGNGQTLGSEYGSGRVFAYLTPQDPAPSLLSVVIFASTPLYTAPNGARAGSVSKASYLCTRKKVDGSWWYQIKSNLRGGSTTLAGRWFKGRSAAMEVRYA